VGKRMDAAKRAERWRERRRTWEERVDAAVRLVAPVWGLRRQEARDRQRAASAYRDASNGRMHRRRSGLGGTANKHLTDSTLWTLRERCRAVVRENTLAAGILQTDVDNTVHMGFSPRPNTDSEAWNEEALAYWREQVLDVRGILSNADMQRLSYLSARRDGDVGFVLTEGQLQPIEGDRIATPQRLAGGAGDLTREARSAIINGIAFDGKGAPVKYYIATKHPTSAYVDEAEAVAAKDFVFLVDPYRFSASRGRPVLGGVLDELDRLEDVIEADTWAHIMAACYGLIIKTGNMKPSYGTSETNPSSGQTEQWEELEPGMIKRIPRMDEIAQITPQHPGTGFAELIKIISRYVGRHMGLPVELVWLDFTANNWSNTRAALLQAYRTFRRQQQWFEWNWCRPVWSYVVGYGVQKRRLLKPPKGQLGRVAWRKPGWQWVDIKDQAQAAVLMIKNRLRTRGDVIAETSDQDFAEVNEELVAEEAEMGEEVLERLDALTGKKEAAEPAEKEGSK